MDGEERQRRGRRAPTSARGPRLEACPEPSSRGELLVPLPTVIAEATHLRGAALTLSLSEIEARGHSERYWGSAPRAQRAQLRAIDPLAWVEMELAMIHYRAIDALNLGPVESASIGRATAERSQSGLVSTLVRALQASGTLSPLGMLRRIDLLWSRNVRGGAACVRVLGPKDARVEFHSCAVAALSYVRFAWVGYFESALAPTSRRVVVRALQQTRSDCAAYAVSWV